VVPVYSQQSTINNQQFSVSLPDYRFSFFLNWYIGLFFTLRQIFC
jgi:hypothetical protein